MTVPKAHTGLFACEPFNHGKETNISEIARRNGYSAQGMNLHVTTMAKKEEEERIDWSRPKYPETVTLKTEGDVLEGKVKEVGEVTLEDRNAGYLRILTADGERTFWLGKVLSEEVERIPIKKGDYVGIKYLGEKPSHKGNPYKDYDMRVIPAEVPEGIDLEE